MGVVVVRESRPAALIAPTVRGSLNYHVGAISAAGRDQQLKIPPNPNNHTMHIQIRQYQAIPGMGKDNCVILDLKYSFDPSLTDMRL